MSYKDVEDRRAYASLHYQSNKASYKKRAAAYTKNHRINLRKFVREYLSNHPCVDCGEADIVVLEFDHIRGKKASIADMMSQSVSLETIEAEIAKCEVRCANCHRRITHYRRCLN